MQKPLVELLGTFFLVLVVGLTVIGIGAGPMTPLAIGSILMVMIYAGGAISGAHYNPAVTLAVYLRGKCPQKDLPWYMGAQAAGAMLAALVVRLCTPVSYVSLPPPRLGPVVLLEVLFTFALAFVVLQVATSKRTAGNSYFGLAIGFTVLAGAYAAGPISGGVFNPAVGLGLMLLNRLSIGNLVVYAASQVAGGALAAYVFRRTNPDEA